jgi:hypothetical protein
VPAVKASLDADVTLGYDEGAMTFPGFHRAVKT